MGTEKAQKNEANRAWNLLAEFIADGTVEEIPGGRKRHKYYRLKNPTKLQEFLKSEALLLGVGEALNGISRPAGAGPERLVRIEGDIRAIREDQAAIREELASLNAKVAQLVQAWT